jgi:hypothetical protein
MGTQEARSPAEIALFPAVRSAVLQLLHGAPEEACHLREVVRRTGLGVGHVQRELGRLVRGGVVRRRSVGRRVLFQADPDCPLFPAIRALVARTTPIADLLRAALRPLAGRIECAWLHGPAARGDPTGDVEILVVGRARLADLVRALEPLEPALGRSIDLTSCSSAEARARLAADDHLLTSVLRADPVVILGDPRLDAAPPDPAPTDAAHRLGNSRVAP